MPKTLPADPPRQDRLSAIISRFEMRVAPCEPSAANLLLFAHTETGQPTRLVFSPGNERHADLQSSASGTHSAAPCEFEIRSFTAAVAWGGSTNPLLAALPHTIDLPIDKDPDMTSLAHLLTAESKKPRCGSETVLSKLAEVLMVKLLRYQLEHGQTSTGLLGGLADKRLARAIIALHEHPGYHWNNNELAQVAGLSVSRFVELFGQTVGQTPMSYLRHWRMILARQDVERGDRIQLVADRYGYASSEALGRAFRKAHKINPTGLRRSTTASHLT
jgi:AraC-like DNA-binding protein